MEEVSQLIEEALEISKKFLSQQNAVDAELVLQQILKVEEDNFQALKLLGLTYQAQQKYPLAEDIAVRLLKQQPDDAELYNNLALSCSSQGKLAEAKQHMKKAIELQPSSNYYGNLGLFYCHENDVVHGLECFEKALQLNESNVYAWMNMGSAYGRMQDIDRSVACLEKAVSIDPGNKQARVNLAYAYLLKGELKKGWQEYEHRYDTFEQLDYFKKLYPQHKKWIGQNIQNKKIVVYGEQGIGDTIQFSRFLPELKKLGCEILLHIPEPLVGLFQDNPHLGHSDIKSVYKEDEYDYFCSMMSLPFLLKIDHIEDKPYLRSSSPMNLDMYSFYKYKVGVVWAGNPRHPNDVERSCMLSNFSVLQLPYVKLFSLQKETSKRKYTFRSDVVDFTQDCNMKLVDMSPSMGDFKDTASIVASLDAVVCVDTAVLHLAGAMGKPVLGLIPYNPDWRWGVDKHNTQWYGSVKLFRQKKPGDWASAFSQAYEYFLSNFR